MSAKAHSLELPSFRLLSSLPSPSFLPVCLPAFLPSLLPPSHSTENEMTVQGQVTRTDLRGRRQYKQHQRQQSCVHSTRGGERPTPFTGQTWGGDTVFLPTLQMRKRWFREVRRVPQSHTAGAEQSWASSGGAWLQSPALSCREPALLPPGVGQAHLRPSLRPPSSSWGPQHPLLRCASLVLRGLGPTCCPSTTSRAGHCVRGAERAGMRSCGHLAGSSLTVATPPAPQKSTAHGYLMPLACSAHPTASVTI